MATFKACEVLPGVTHIQDPMGVCMTLLCGSRQALLIDAGYGLWDVHAFVRTLTELPLRLLLTHAHHDHAMGACWFDEAGLLDAERPYYDLYTDEAHRQTVFHRAVEQGLQPPPITRPMPLPTVIQPGSIDLGGLTARIIACPGHTPGSFVVEVPERKLLLTGDNWNPCTWAFFPETPGVSALKRNMQPVLDLPFEHVLCSHRPDLFPRESIDFFYQNLTQEALAAAPKVDMGWNIDTHQLNLPDGQYIVFDLAKLDQEE